MMDWLKTKLWVGLPKRVVIACLIVLCNLFLFEGLTRIIYCFHPPMDTYNENYDLKFHLAEHGPDADKTILFLGDSLTERAVYPEYLQMLLREKGLETDILNLSTGAATPPISFQMLKHRVDENKKPNLVIMNITFRSFHQYWQTEPMLGNDPNKSMRESYYGQCRFEKPHGLNKFVCLAKDKFIIVRYPQLLNDFFHQFNDYVFDTKSKMWSLRDNLTALFFKRGWVPHQSDYKTREEFEKYLFAKRNAFFRYDAFFPDIARRGWYTESYMDVIADYCQKEKIPLVLVLLPEIKTFSQNFYSHSLKIPKTVFLKRVTDFSEKWHVVFWNLSDSMQNNRLYADTSHLNLLGAIQYNYLFAGKLLKNKKLISQEPK